MKRGREREGRRASRTVRTGEGAVVVLRGVGGMRMRLECEGPRPRRPEKEGSLVKEGETWVACSMGREGRRRVVPTGGQGVSDESRGVGEGDVRVTSSR